MLFGLKKATLVVANTAVFSFLFDAVDATPEFIRGGRRMDECEVSSSEEVPPPDYRVTFSDVSQLISAYQAVEYEGLVGVAWLDYDDDGDLDIFLPNGKGGSTKLIRNNGDGTFTDVTVAAGVHSTAGFAGVVVGDIDNDGYPDIFMTGAGPFAYLGLNLPENSTLTKLYHNNGDGTFADITASAGIEFGFSGMGATMADYDNDGYLDIFIAGLGAAGPIVAFSIADSNKLYMNNGDLTFTEVGAAAGVDGLYVNEFGDTTSEGACVATSTDYDSDGLIDILVGNCNAFPPPQNTTGSPNGFLRATPFSLYRNNGDGTFTDKFLEAGLDVDGFWMGIAMADYDNDGNIDFFATSAGNGPFAGTTQQFGHDLFRNNGDGTYSRPGSIPNSEFGWGCTFADFDNNGGKDLYIVGSLAIVGLVGPGFGQPGRLYMNDGAGNFAEETGDTNIDFSDSYTSGLAQGDFNGDGFADLLVMAAPYTLPPFPPFFGAPPLPGAILTAALLENNGNGNHYITVRTVGTTSNRDGVGALVQIRFGDDKYQTAEVLAGSSYASMDQPWPSFGLGNYDAADIRISWPSGLVEWFEENCADQIVTVVEGTGEEESESD